jgi:hypothetical protein
MKSSPRVPASIVITSAPTWSKDIFGDYLPPHTTLYLEEDAKNSHVEFISANGRGIAGVAIGGEQFVPHWQDDRVFKKYADGIFVFTPRNFP